MKMAGDFGLRMDKALKLLHSRKIQAYTTQLQFRPKRRVGHFDISLFLKNDDGKISDRPLIKGIYSKGNRSQNIQGWFDIHYSDRADFDSENPVILSRFGRCAEDVFEMIGGAIEPGGMIFVSLITDIVWEMESELHKVTRDCLSIRSLGIPPAATPLGRLLFIGGCRNIKSQAFDVQGSSRLAGEKAFNPDIERQFAQKIRIQLQEFLARRDKRESAEFDKICKIGRLNAEDVLNRFLCSDADRDCS
jgi:hypothetical protein